MALKAYSDGTLVAPMVTCAVVALIWVISRGVTSAAVAAKPSGVASLDLNGRRLVAWDAIEETGEGEDILTDALDEDTLDAAAEEIAVGEISTGAQNDLQRVTDLARAMVTEWGMSDKLGMIQYTEDDEYIFLGREMIRGKAYSEKLAQQRVTQGRMSATEQEALLARITASADVQTLKGCELIVEAVFEQAVDGAGNPVRTLADAPSQAAGRHEVLWDGRTDAGTFEADVMFVALGADLVVQSDRFGNLTAMHRSASMLSMRYYPLGFIAAVLTMIPGTSACCLLGLPLGIWAIVVLVRPEVRAAFR